MPHPVDIELGKKLRQIRKSRGMSQTQLGQQLGITFQQIQKYENGQNRISVSRLVDLAGMLQLPIQCFFEDFHEKSQKDEILEKLERLNWDSLLDFLSRFDNSSDVFIRSLVKFFPHLTEKKSEAKQVLDTYYVMQKNLFTVLPLLKSLRNLVRTNTSDFSRS